MRTATEVLESLRKRLHAQPSADAELLEILEAHLLTMEQGPDAVQETTSEIEELAQRRVEDGGGE